MQKKGQHTDLQFIMRILRRVKSEKGFVRVALCLCVLLTIGSASTWGETVTFDGTADWGSTTQEYAPDSFKIDASHVTFSLKKNMKQYNKQSWGSFKSHEYFFLEKDKSSQLRWWVDKGYAINVSAIYFYAKNSRATIFSDYGKGYVHTSRMSQSNRLQVCQSGSAVSKTFALSDPSNNLFGATPSPLTNNEYFVLTTATNEWQIYTCSLTYTIAPKTYTITLDSEGGVGGSSSVTLTYDSNSHAAITNPTKDGYTFAGWWTGDNGTGSLVIAADGTMQANVSGYTGAGGIWKKDAATTLYAKWTENSVVYSVRFNGNGSTAGSMGTQAFACGTPQNLSSNGFAKTCTVTYNANGGSCGVPSDGAVFTFAGWATSPAGAVVYADGAEVLDLTTTPGAIVDLYAKWSAKASVLELPMPTRADGVFAGWYDSDEVRVGGAGDLYAPSGNETLKAHWKPGVSSVNNSSDVSDGKIVLNGPHATFTISGANELSYYTEGSCGDDGYLLGTIEKEESARYTWSWSSDDCTTIEVTNIAFWGKAYNWAAGRASTAKMLFNGKTTNVGTAALTCNSGDYSKFSESGSFSSPMTLECQNTFTAPWYDVIPPYDFDFYIKNIAIEYIVTAKAPTPHSASIFVTLDVTDKQTIAVGVNSGSGALFTMANPASDFTYSYRLKEDYEHAFIEGGYFWADAPGDYEVQARVNSDEDHEASTWATAIIHVLDWPYIFTNKTGDEQWETLANWYGRVLPSESDSVRVIGDLTIDEERRAYYISIEDTAIVTIAPDGGLTIGAGGVSGATTDNLLLQAQSIGANRGRTGYLRISPLYTGAMPEATVEMYSKAYYNTKTHDPKWQYIGTPLDEPSLAAKDVFTQSYLYSWDEAKGDWVNQLRTLVMEPFKGYITTQRKNADGIVISYEGQLVSGRTPVEVPLSYTAGSLEPGCNVLANSFAAPMDISQFLPEDFSDGVTATIYLFNTGSQSDIEYRENQKAVNVAADGQYLAIPIGSAASLHDEMGYPIVIPSMQGFYVETSKSGTLTLNYERLVWNADYSGERNTPMRVQSRNQKAEDNPLTGALQVTLSANNQVDHLYMLAADVYSREYENGYDAPKKMSDDTTLPCVFAAEEDRQMSVDATSELAGTRIGVYTGAEEVFTFAFSHIRADEELVLIDHETEQTIDISEETEYTFLAAPYTTISERFELGVRNAGQSSVTTDCSEVNIENKVQKYIQNNQLFILKGGVRYNAQGMRVR